MSYYPYGFISTALFIMATVIVMLETGVFGKRVGLSKRSLLILWFGLMVTMDVKGTLLFAKGIHINIEVVLLQSALFMALAMIFTVGVVKNENRD